MLLLWDDAGSEDMFKTAMSKMNVDVKRMPLGQLSNAQVRFAGVGVQAFLIRTQKRSIRGTPDSRHPTPRKTRGVPR